MQVGTDNIIFDYFFLVYEKNMTLCLKRRYIEGLNTIKSEDSKEVVAEKSQKGRKNLPL